MWRFRLAKTKRKIADILDSGLKKGNDKLHFDFFIEILVLLNVLAVILESFEAIEVRFHEQLNAFEFFTVSVFTIEFIFRIWISDIKYPRPTKWLSVKKFLLTPSTLIDILAIMPFFIPFVIQIDLRYLRIVRLVRLMRVFKLVKYSHAIIYISKIVIEKKRELVATFLLMFSILILNSSVMYYVEHEAQPEAFPNILFAFWWGIITLTTVGYGDVYPITVAGKLLGGFTALLGVLIVALPTGIISSSFVQKLEENNNLKRISDVKERLKKAFYKRYVPELGILLIRGQISMEAIKLNLEISENDIYKIAEGKNEFRFRNKRVVKNSMIAHKLYVEYREMNSVYGILTDRNARITLISPESLKKESVGYFTYCIAEKLKANYMTNEFYGEEPAITEESFGDSELEEEMAISFQHNEGYQDVFQGDLHSDFIKWRNDLKNVKQKGSLYIIFTTFSKFDFPDTTFKLYFLKEGHPQTIYSLQDPTKAEALKQLLIQNTLEKLNYTPVVKMNPSSRYAHNQSMLSYIFDKVGAEVIVFQILEDCINENKIFTYASIVSDAINHTFSDKMRTK
jgi:voltage-gated potassium channel